jgi:hypothetical protein
MNDANLLTALSRPRHERVNGWDRPQLTLSRARIRARGNLSGPGLSVSGPGLSDIPKPLMLAVGVPQSSRTLHVLRHTYGSLYMTHPAPSSPVCTPHGPRLPRETIAVDVHHRYQALEDVLANTSANPQRSRGSPGGASSEKDVVATCRDSSFERFLQPHQGKFFP